MQRIFAWLGGATFILICLIVAAVFAYRAAAIPYLESHMFVTQSPGTTTPAALGVPYKPVRIDSNGRALEAGVVNAGADTPALLLFNGNGQTIHDWANVQAYLYKQHVSSMVFNYSGFGKSAGKPTVRNLNQDARAAWRTFAAWAGPARPKFVVAYSLGTAIALHNAPDFRPQPLGIAVYGAFSSTRDLMIYLHAVPAWLGPVSPDPWDSVLAALRLREPLLVVAGMNDTNVPPNMGRQIALFASEGSGGEFILVPNAGHEGIEHEHMAAVWAPILDFVQRRVDNAPAVNDREKAAVASHHTSQPRSSAPGSSG